jgi:hypothetical protein
MVRRKSHQALRVEQARRIARVLGLPVEALFFESIDQTSEAR